MSDEGELVWHSRFTGAELSGASWGMALCDWSGKPAPETRPAQLELETPAFALELDET